MEGFPMREWHVKIYVLDEAGKEKPATCFNKVTYNLHPSFENPNQSTRNRPKRGPRSLTQMRNAPTSSLMHRSRMLY